MVTELEASVPVGTEVAVVEGAGVPEDSPESVEFDGGNGTEEITVLVPGELLVAAVREDGGILNGAGDPGSVVEDVPLLVGKGTELAVGKDWELVTELIELSVTCVEPPVEPTGKVELGRVEGPEVCIDGGGEDAPVPSTERLVVPVDRAEAVELDNGNGAVLPGTEDGPVEPGNPPVDKGPTVSVSEGAVTAAEDELVVAGVYGESVCVMEAGEPLVMLVNGVDVEAVTLAEPETALAVEFKAG